MPLSKKPSNTTAKGIQDIVWHISFIVYLRPPPPPPPLMLSWWNWQHWPRVSCVIEHNINHHYDHCWLIAIWQRGTSGQHFLNAHSPILGVGGTRVNWNTTVSIFEFNQTILVVNHKYITFHRLYKNEPTLQIIPVYVQNTNYYHPWPAM